MTIKSRNSQSESIFCPECDGHVINDIFKGDSICYKCGLVQNEKNINFSWSKRKFSYEEYRKRSRTGPPITKLDFSLHSTFNMKECNKSDLIRILKRNYYYFYSNKEKNYSKTIRELKRIGCILNLPQYVLEDTFLLYKKARQHKLTVGWGINATISACLYCICRKRNILIFFNEIIEASLAPENKIRNCFFILVKDFNIKLPGTNLITYTSKICSLFNLSLDFEHKINKILNIIPEHKLIGRNPKIIIATLIYFVCKKEQIKLTQKQITERIGISEVSIRNTLKIVKKFFI